MSYPAVVAADSPADIAEVVAPDYTHLVVGPRTHTEVVGTGMVGNRRRRTAVEVGRRSCCTLVVEMDCRSRCHYMVVVVRDCCRDYVDQLVSCDLHTEHTYGYC